MSTTRGFALVLVLWASALLSVIAAGFAFAMRAETQSAGHLADAARAGALAEAGVRRGILALLDPSENAWRADGTEQQVTLGEATLRIRLTAENGKIDLNRAPEALVEGLFSVAGAGEHAVALAQAVLDWRDKDDRPRPAGAEDAEYAEHRRPYGAADRPFRSVAELNQVLGMRPELFERVAGMLTIHSRLARVDPAYAPRAVLLAVPDLDAGAVDAFLEARRLRAPDERLPMELLAPAERHLVRTRASVYTVRAEAQLPNGARGRREAVVRVTRNEEQPYLILAWSQPMATGPALSRVADAAARTD